MGWLGPNSGARDGNKDYRAMTNIPRGKTGSNWRAERKQAKADERKAIKAEKRAIKKQAQREAREAAKAEGKSSFFW